MNNLFLLICAAICANISDTTWGAPTTYNAEDDLKQYILAVLENIRTEMPVGIPALNIPVLEPFQLQDKVFNITNPTASVHLAFPELKVVGFSTFKGDVEVMLGRMGVEVDLTFDHIKANGKYNLDGKIVKIFPIYGNGDVRLDLLKPRVVLAAQLLVNNEELNIMFSKLEMTWDKLDAHLGNLVGGGSLARIVELVLPPLLQKVLVAFNPQILDLFSKLINSVIAKHANKPEIKAMIKSIFGES